MRSPKPGISGTKLPKQGGGDLSRCGRVFRRLLLLRRPGIFAARLDVSVDELDDRLRAGIAVAEASPEHAGVAALALLVARADHVEQFAHHGNVAHFRDRLPTPGQPALFGEGN